MDWGTEAQAAEAARLMGGVVIAFFGWDIFRLAKQATGAVSGALFGSVLFILFGVPAALSARGVDPLAWGVALISLSALAGYLLLKRLRTVGTFIPGVLLGYLCGSLLLGWLGIGGGGGLSVKALLGGIAGGVAILVSEKIAVTAMTAFLGSMLAAAVFPWEPAVLLFFAISFPLQLWIQAGRPLPFQKERE
jgi:hypothetical protein